MPGKEPREHGFLFGRGDDLPEGTEEPPYGHIPVVPAYGPTAVPFGEPPAEQIRIEGEVPWELRDDDHDANGADSDAAAPGPIIH